MEGLQKLEVPERLSVSEAAGMFEVWMKDRGLHSGESFGRSQVFWGIQLIDCKQCRMMNYLWQNIQRRVGMRGTSFGGDCWEH